jgi:MFS family permease
MSIFKQNRNLAIIALIAVVNALGYGIIIPILYSYSHKFGLTDFQNGLLFSIFSLCQFFATPVIGRLSDVYGRKPLLVVSIAGTALSFFLMAFANNALMLFVARALDGITAGNIPVASAVISDTTAPKDRAKGFGIIGASFGFGFIFGPAISALTVGFGEAVPFLIAGSVSAIAAILTYFLLPETNKHIGLVKKGKLFDFVQLFKALFDKNVGLTLLISFIYSFAFSLFIYAYQPLSVRLLHLTPVQISINFTLFGLIGLISQAFIIPRVTKRFGEKPMLRNALMIAIFTFTGLFFTRSLLVLTIMSIFHSLANGFINPLIQSLLSQEVDEHSQGSIQGVNASYMSIGMIVGPIIGGLLATISIPMPFLVGAGCAGICYMLSLRILTRSRVAQVTV